ncbi:hypothetical protein, partial [uncultured Treponema sp.]|uniref:hypothetical protein n=1 Tax=uncultured Treponema sp. TaxID=162155 RepID=UPI0025948EEC
MGKAGKDFSNLDIHPNAAPARIWVLRQDKKLLAQFFYNLDIHPNAAPARIFALRQDKNCLRSFFQ